MTSSACAQIGDVLLAKVFAFHTLAKEEVLFSAHGFLTRPGLVMYRWEGLGFSLVAEHARRMAAQTLELLSLHPHESSKMTIQGQ